MRVLWVLGTHESEHGPTTDPSLVAASPIASDRLRVALPAAGLSGLGVESEFCALRPGVPPPAPERYDAVVFGKFSSPAVDETGRVEWWWAFAERALSAGCRVVVDVSDNPFAGVNPRTGLYARLLPACGGASVPSAWLAQAIVGRCRSAPRVIADPYEGIPSAPRFAPADPVRLLWFGHPSNLRHLQTLVPSLAQLAEERALALEVVTGLVQDIESGLESLSRRLAPRFSARYTPWSLETMPGAFERCDLVIIPSDPGHPKKAGASPNRLVEALVAGRLPVATPLEAYQPYAQYAVLEADLVAGLRRAWSAPAEMLERIRAGQQAALERHALEVVARQWFELLAPSG